MKLPALAYRAHTAYNRIFHGFPNRYARLLAEARRAKPRTIVEIGTWRGDRAEELLETALVCHPPQLISFFAFDLFEEMSAETAVIEGSRSTLNPTEEEVRKRLARFSDAGVTIEVVAGNTLETLPKASLPTIDFAFIDGGHSYGTVRSDWQNIAKRMGPNSVVVFDDYVNQGAIRAYDFGVNKLVNEIDKAVYDVEVLHPADWWPKEWGLMKNQLVKVRLAGSGSS